MCVAVYLHGMLLQHLYVTTVLTNRTSEAKEKNLKLSIFTTHAMLARKSKFMQYTQQSQENPIWYIRALALKEFA